MAIFIIYFLLKIAFYISQAWGLYTISKKLGDDLPWLAWVPLVQMYTMVKAGGKSGWWILWIFLGLICFLVPGLILIITMLHGISKRTGNGGWTTVGFFFVPFIMFPIVGYNLESSEKIEIIELSN